MQNKLQFLRASQNPEYGRVFKDREAALYYLKTIMDYQPLFAEPVVLQYQDKENEDPSLLLVLGCDNATGDSRYFVIDNAQTLKDIQAVSALAMSNRVTMVNTNSIDFTTIATPSGKTISADVNLADYAINDKGKRDETKPNIIQCDTTGLFTYVDLVANKDEVGHIVSLTFSVNDTDKVIELPYHQIILSGHYDTATESLVFDYCNGTHLVIPLSKLIEEWVVDNGTSNVTLTRTRVKGEESSAYGDKLSANLNVSTGATNVLKEVLESEKHVLAVEVSKNKDSIIFKDGENDIQAIVKLDYSQTENKIIFTHTDCNGNEVIEEHQLNSAKLIDDITYDSVNRILTIRYIDMSGAYQRVNIDMREMIKDLDWVAYSEGHSVQLTKTEAISGTVNLTADVKVADSSDFNILEVKTPSHELYVKGTADNIIYDTDTKTTVRKKIKSLENDINTLSGETNINVDNASHTVKLYDSALSTGHTLSADVVLDKTLATNIIKSSANGIFASVTLDYNAEKNALVFTSSDGIDKTLVLSGASLIEDISYDTDTECIIFKYKVGGVTKTTEVDVRKLIDEWTVAETDTIILDREVVKGGGKDILTANVKVDNVTVGNILEVKGANGLYVSNSAITANTKDIADLRTDLTTETTNRTNADDALEVKINTNSGDIATLKTDLTTETTNRTNADTALETKIDKNTADIATLRTDLTTETTNRIDADSALETKINTNTTDIANLRTDLTQEIADRKDGDEDTLESAKTYTDAVTSAITLTFEDTKTIDFTKTGTVVKAEVILDGSHGDNMILSGSGLYAKATLDYDSGKNVLKFTTSNATGDTTTEIPLNAGSLLDNMEVTESGGTKYIDVTFHSSSSAAQQHVYINVSDLLNDFSAVTRTDEAVEVKVTNSGKTKVISADAVISTDPHNMLKKDGINGLFVSDEQVTANTKAIQELSAKTDDYGEEIDNIETAVGLKDDGTYDTGATVTTNYIKSSTTYIDNDKILDTKLSELSGTVEDLGDRIDDLDVGQVGADGSYIKYISETDGKISAVTQSFDKSIDTGSTDNNVPTSKAVYSFVTAATGNAINSLDVATVGGVGSFVQSIGETDGKITPSAVTFVTDITGNTTSQVAPTTNAVYNYVTSAITSATTGLDAGPFGDTGTVVTSVSETDGKITATTKTLDGSIDSSKTGVPSTQAVYNYVTSAITSATTGLDVGQVGADGSYIKYISETDGKISAVTQSFDKSIDTGSTDNNVPTSKAVYSFVTAATGNAINSLDVDNVGGAGQYIQNISEKDGKIIPSAVTFVTDVTGNTTSQVAPTTNAVYNFVTAATGNAIGSLDVSKIGDDNTIVTSVSETDGKVSATTKTLDGSIDSSKTGVPSTQAVYNYVTSAITSATTGLDAGPFGKEGQYIQIVQETDGKVSATPKDFDQTIGSSSTSGNVPSSKAVYETITAATGNAIGSLDVSKIGDDNTIVTSVSETDGKVSATTKPIDTAITASSTGVPSTQAVYNYVTSSTPSFSSLTVDDKGGTGKYIQLVGQTDGKIHATEQTFDQTIGASSTTGNVPSSQAVYNLVTSNTPSFSTLTVTDIGKDGSYIKIVGETDGKIHATAQTFDTSLGAGSTTGNIPSSKAVVDYVTDEISDTLEGLDVTPIGGSGKYVETVLQENGKVSATTKAFDTAVSSTGTSVPTTQAVYNYVSGITDGLDAAKVGEDGSYIKYVEETNGVVKAEKEAFITDITGNTASKVAPTTKAVYELVTGITDGLDAGPFGDEYSYIQAIEQKDGKVSASAETLVSSITATNSASTVPCTTQAVMTVITEDERVYSNALNAIRNGVGLDNNGNYVPYTTGKYISGATSMDEAVDMLNDAIDNNNYWTLSGIQLQPKNAGYTVGAAGFYETSDKNLKHNIANINASDTRKVDNVKLQEFILNADKTNTKKYGVIAQELESVGLENLVHTNDNGQKSVDYISFLILKIQQLENRIKELENNK